MIKMPVGRFLFALLLIVIGVTAFMINLGYGSWEIFSLISKWWPLLLIIIGLAMFWQGKIPPMLAYLLVVLAVGSVIGYMMVNAPALPLRVPW